MRFILLHPTPGDGPAGAHLAPPEDPQPSCRPGELPPDPGHLPIETSALEAIVQEVRRKLAEVLGRQPARAAEGAERIATELEPVLAALTQAQQELAARREQLDAEHAELAERVRRLTRLEHDYAERDQQLQARLADLEQRAQAVRQRRAAVDKLYQQAFEINERAQRQYNDFVARRQALAEREAAIQQREAALQQRQLQLELERAQLEADRSAFEQAHQALAEVADPLEETSRADSSAPLAAAPLPPAPSPPPRPSRRWLRSLTLSTIGGVAAWAAWLAWEQPLYRASLELTVRNDPPPLPADVAAHLANLLRPEEIARRLADADAAAWRAALAGGLLTARPAETPQQIVLSLTGRRPQEQLALLRVAASGYAARVRDRAGTVFLGPQREAWQRQREAVETDLAQACSQLEELRTQREQAEASSVLEESKSLVRLLQAEYEQAARELEQARAELDWLRSQPPPTGIVAPQTLEAALTADAVYLEDRSEFQSLAREYRTELAVAMVLVEEPARELRSATHALARVLAEQRDLDPPQALRTELEAALSLVEGFDTQAAGFLNDWGRCRETLERTDPTGAVVDLLAAQQQAAAAATAVNAAAAQLREQLEQAVMKLTAGGEDATRASVVAALLRGELGQLAARIDALAQAAERVSPAHNVRLDATDRQLRNLQTRLRDRREVVRVLEQQRVDAAARAEHEARIDQAAARVTELEHCQADALARLLDAHARLAGAQEAARSAEGYALAEERIAAQVQRLEQRLAEVQHAEPVARPDELVIGTGRVAQIAGLQRGRNALLAGAAAFGALWIVCRLMVPRGGARPAQPAGSRALRSRPASAGPQFQQ